MRNNRPENLAGTLAWARRHLSEKGVATADLDSRLLLQLASGLEAPALLSERNRLLKTGEIESYRDLVTRRGEGVPLAYLAGLKEFWSLTFEVDRRVLVPRPETELLIERSLEHLDPGCSVVDVGTGCGNIIIALAAELGRGAFRAVDLSRGALEIAKRNLRRHNLEEQVELVEGDLLTPFKGRSPLFDAILSNPPYIRSADLDGLQREVALFEPRSALDGGEDGLAFVRRLIDDAPKLLKGGGLLAVEIGAGQGSAAADYARRHEAYGEVAVQDDLAGIPRLLSAVRKVEWTA